MEVHIGSIIKARAKALRVGPTELGIKIESSKQNVYGIFKRDSIDSELLYRICIALEHDFFQYFSEWVTKELMVVGIDSAHVSSKTELPQRSEDIARENAYLRRLNALLEEKLNKLQGE
jgi:hypothetical protein